MSVDLTEAMIKVAIEEENWDAVRRLAAQIDAEAPPKPPVPFIAAALWYAEQGLRVFALQPWTKIPYLGTRGVLDANAAIRDVDAAWRANPDSNIGIATGHLVDVIDIDGPEGVRSWVAMIESLPPILGVVSTVRPGGTHLYVAANGSGNRAGMEPGIDYRGRGGYVVAPPSVGPSGVRYRWRRPLILPMEATPVLPADGVAPQEVTRCAVCQTPMTVVEAGQTTHPGCSDA